MAEHRLTAELSLSRESNTESGDGPASALDEKR
jgi:hypothetical protein